MRVSPLERRLAPIYFKRNLCKVNQVVNNAFELIEDLFNALITL